MQMNNSYKNFKRIGLGIAILMACAANVYAAQEKNKDAPAPAPHADAAGPGRDAQHPAGVHPDVGHADAFHGGPARPGEARPHYTFRDHDVRHFNHDDLVRWRGGRWRNTCFNGRCGNWWFAGDQWYFYAQPVYPYPVVVSDVTYVEPVVVAAPAPVVVVPAPVAAPLHLAPPPKFWYYCDNPRGYYPAVATCNTQFHQVSTPPSP